MFAEKLCKNHQTNHTKGWCCITLWGLPKPLLCWNFYVDRKDFLHRHWCCFCGGFQLKRKDSLMINETKKNVFPHFSFSFVLHFPELRWKVIFNFHSTHQTFSFSHPRFEVHHPVAQFAWNFHYFRHFDGWKLIPFESYYHFPFHKLGHDEGNNFPLQLNISLYHRLVCASNDPFWLSCLGWAIEKSLFCIKTTWSRCCFHIHPFSLLSTCFSPSVFPFDFPSKQFIILLDCLFFQPLLSGIGFLHSSLSPFFVRNFFVLFWYFHYISTSEFDCEIWWKV